jgi:2-hydroxy-6-oxonona-2,4-dienedioate hydrolase
MSQSDRAAHTFESTSRQTRTRSWNLHWNEAGTGDAVILLHGSGPGATGWTNFEPNIRALSASYRVIAIDMPGWGRSDPARARDRDHPNAVVELMDEMGLGQAAIVGNSMGAATALACAVRYPERVSHLVMMGGGMFGVPTMFAPADGPSEGLKTLHQAYADPTLESISRLVGVMTFDDAAVNPELIQDRLSDVLRNREHLANYLADLGEPASLRMSVPDVGAIMKLTVPTLLLHGRDDRVVSYEHSLRLLSMIKDSRLMLFNRCGHWVQLERADEFNAAVAAFLTPLRRTSHV